MRAHRRIINESTTDTATVTTKSTAKIKLEEKVGQYLIITAMGAESRGTARPTSGKTNEMGKRDPITTV